ncbi:MAG: T9SS type A sorting domain-containing protein [Candidatus Marinimicrobia bacterium]|nr:T9SS type A sorting domain-containing protein [Candidatus Neomarinimicrobiota bacterium]
MKLPKSVFVFSTLFILAFSSLHAGKYFILCEGNFGQANASLWSIDESLQNIEGPLIWNASSNPLGDVGQSLTLHDHTLYVVMNGSHEVRIIDLESDETHSGDIEIPESSPRFMAVHSESGLGYISSWGLGGLLVVNLENHAIVDTISLGALPEEILIVENEMFVSVPMRSDWSASNKILRIDLSGNTPEVTHTYDVIDGPGAMAMIGDQLYVSSIYYNDAWETFSGTSRIDISDHSVTTLDHGFYTNYTADINIIDGVAYRTFGNSIVPVNEDLSLNSARAIGNISGIYSHSVANNNILIGSSDFVAPDLVSILSLDGQEIASFNVGALPSQIVYYSPDIVSADETIEVPSTFSLGNNYPNPFNPSTSIPFSLEFSGDVRLSIYDIKGRIVANLIEDHLIGGEHISNWDGTNARGEAVSSGIYHAILYSNSQSSSIKLNLIK